MKADKLTAEHLRELSPDELENQLKDFKGQLFNLRFQLATGQLSNPMRVREVRKNIARIKTIMHQRALNLSK